MEFFSLTGDQGLCRPPWKVSLFVLKEKCFQLKKGRFLTSFGVGRCWASHSCYLQSTEHQTPVVKNCWMMSSHWESLVDMSKSCFQRLISTTTNTWLALDKLKLSDWGQKRNKCIGTIIASLTNRCDAALTRDDAFQIASQSLRHVTSRVWLVPCAKIKHFRKSFFKVDQRFFYS